MEFFSWLITKEIESEIEIQTLSKSINDILEKPRISMCEDFPICSKSSNTWDNICGLIGG